MSEVARIREKIILEGEVMRRAMEGYAVVSSHDTIITRYDNLGKQKDELAKHIGEQAANDELVQIYAKVVG